MCTSLDVSPSASPWPTARLPALCDPGPHAVSEEGLLSDAILQCQWSETVSVGGQWRVRWHGVRAAEPYAYMYMYMNNHVIVYYVRRKNKEMNKH